MDESVLQDLLQGPSATQISEHDRRPAHLKSILDAQLSLGGVGGNLDLRGGGIDLNFISSVRHPVHVALVSVGSVPGSEERRTLVCFGWVNYSDVFFRYR